MLGRKLVKILEKERKIERIKKEKIDNHHETNHLLISLYLCHHPVRWRYVSGQSNGFLWQHHSCFPHPTPMRNREASILSHLYCLWCNYIFKNSRVDLDLDLQSLTQRRKHLCEDNLLVPHWVCCGLLSRCATLRDEGTEIK